MSEDSEQLEIGKDDDLDAPSHLWATALGRAVFGFYAETHKNKYFINDNYLENLCLVENRVQNSYGKVLIFGFGFSVFSIATANSALGDTEYLGIRIANIPYLTEFCALVLGVIVTSLVYVALDAHALQRMRIELFSTTGSEVPNMRMVHFKGSNAWVDALIPKSIGYSSNWIHRIIQIVGAVWAFMLPASFLSVVISAQFVCMLSLRGLWGWNLSSIMVGFGFWLSVSSILVLILVALLPLKFQLRNQQEIGR